MLQIKEENFEDLFTFTRTLWPEGILVHLWLKMQLNKSLHARPYQSMCFVDKWPNPSVIVGLDLMDEYYGMTQFPIICLWCQADADIFSSFLDNLDRYVTSITSASQRGIGGDCLFCGIPGNQVYHMILNHLFNRNEGEVKLFPNYQFSIPPEKWHQLKTLDIKPPEGFYFDKVNASEAGFVNDTWPHRFPGSFSRMEYRIKNLPNVALRQRATNELACFEVVHDEHGFMNHLYTVEKFRRRGLATAVELKLAQILLNNENDFIVPYKFVVKSNSAGKAMTDVSTWWQDLGHLAFFIQYLNRPIKVDHD